MNLADAITTAREWLLAFVRYLGLLLSTPPEKAGKGVPTADTPGAEDGMRGIAISSGHGARIPGAVGILDEVREARRVVRRVAWHLREMGVAVHEFHDDESDTQWGNLNAIIGWHNRQKRCLDVSVHLNAFSPTDGPMGTEALCISMGAAELASRISKAIARAGGFRYRGPRVRDDLAFLNRVERQAVLIEVCFVDSATDARLYGENFDAICLAIARSLAGTA